MRRAVEFLCLFQTRKSLVLQTEYKKGNMGVKTSLLYSMHLFLVTAQVWDPVSLQLSCFQAQSPGQPPPPLLKRCAAVLDPLTKSVTGLLEGLYLMAKVKYLSGVYKGSVAGGASVASLLV